MSSGETCTAWGGGVCRGSSSRKKKRGPGGMSLLVSPRGRGEGEKDLVCKAEKE